MKSNLSFTDWLGIAALIVAANLMTSIWTKPIPAQAQSESGVLSVVLSNDSETAILATADKYRVIRPKFEVLGKGSPSSKW